MALNNKHVLLLVMFIVFWEVSIASTRPQLGLGEDFVIPYHTTVRVFNNLNSGLNLPIHCKSKDNDLGEHVISNGSSYEWGFRVNVLGSTLFFCGFTWRDAGGVYDIYYAKRETKRCKECIWRVKHDGFCMAIETTLTMMISGTGENENQNFDKKCKKM